MRFSIVRTVAAMGLCAMSLPVSAQSGTIGSGPAELPPAGYSARFYVDSRGCMFISTNSGWVAQVTRDKSPVCGYAPTFDKGSVVSSGTTAATPAPTARTTQPNTLSAVRLPEGYKPAWSDGRLNPMRGPRLQSGDEQMARVWTADKVPMKRREDAPATAGSVTISTKSPDQAAVGTIWVQVGTFGHASNAQTALARLDAVALPAVTRRSGTLTVVMAGPFSSTRAAKAGRSAAIAAGFADAFIR